MSDQKKIEIKPIAYIRTDLDTKFGLPRQSNIIPELKGRIVFEPEFRNSDALRGIEGYSYLWIIWQFSQNVRSAWSPTVRPPVLGGNERVGVFATRSSFRPNALGLSVVKFEEIEKTPDKGSVIVVSGIDMMDNTPIFDIKPYIPMWDSKPDASNGFTGVNEKRSLKVEFDEAALSVFSEEQKTALIKLIQQDPRPAYHNEPERVYGFGFAGRNVKFTVRGRLAEIIDIVDQ